MATETQAGVGFVVSDYTSNCIHIDDVAVTNTELALAAGCETLTDALAVAFTQGDDISDAAIVAVAPGVSGETRPLSSEQRGEMFEGLAARQRIAERAEYRAKTGREFPEVYRVRITLDAEPLSDDEARAYWTARAAAWAAR